MPKQTEKPAEPAGFTFEHDGKTYTLPSGEDVAAQVPGRFLRDALMEGDAGELRLQFAMLDRLDASEAVEALYDMPTPDMLEVIRAWMSHKNDEVDASLGESSSSSD
jgi:hypothetical protein